MQSERVRDTPRPSASSWYASSSTAMQSGIVISLPTSSLDKIRVMVVAHPPVEKTFGIIMGAGRIESHPR